MFIGLFVANNRSEYENQPFLDGNYSRSAFGQALLVVLFIVSTWYMVGFTLSLFEIDRG